MIIKINFTKSNQSIPVSNQKELNSYIHKCVGRNNKFHDAYSNYCISSLQGGKLDKETGFLSFQNDPYILFTMHDKNAEFVAKFLNGVMGDKHTLFGMHYKNIEYLNFNVNEHFDLIYTVSPILIKKYEGGKTIKLSIKDDDFIDTLKENCIKKLKYNDIEDSTFDIELHNPKNGKVKKIFVGGVFNICSMCSFIVKGEKRTREMLYNLGLGNSTGSGFGMVKTF